MNTAAFLAVGLVVVLVGAVAMALPHDARTRWAVPAVAVMVAVLSAAAGELLLAAVQLVVWAGGSALITVLARDGELAAVARPAHRRGPASWWPAGLGAAVALGAVVVAAAAGTDGGWLSRTASQSLADAVRHASWPAVIAAVAALGAAVLAYSVVAHVDPQEARHEESRRERLAREERDRRRREARLRSRGLLTGEEEAGG